MIYINVDMDRQTLLVHNYAHSNTGMASLSIYQDLGLMNENARGDGSFCHVALINWLLINLGRHDRKNRPLLHFISI